MLFTYNSNLTKFFILKKYTFNNLVSKLFNSIIIYVITYNSNLTKFFILNKYTFNNLVINLFNYIIIYIITYNSNLTKFFTQMFNINITGCKLFNSIIICIIYI